MTSERSRYPRYLLTLLAVILAFSYADRLALGLLLQDIKSDLELSDTQLGLLSGIAFSLFYAVMGIPIARWADRGNRVTIIAATVALCSAAVALCGAARSFAQLLVLRGAVAVGEAGCIPPAQSLIADHFSRAERPRATARYWLGAQVSVVIGYFLAGWLNEFYGWRMTFVLLGLPGLGLAAVAWLTLREPRSEKPRMAATKLAGPTLPNAESARLPSVQPSLKEVCVTLWAKRTFRYLLLFFPVSFFFGSGIGVWQAVFFIRTYGLGTGELGTWLTVIAGLGGVLGTYCGGEWASRHAANDERLQLKAMAVVYCGCAVVSAGVYLSPDLYLAFALMALTAVGYSTGAGPLWATIQSVVPDRMRAMSVALMFFFANLVGAGLGPLAAGALSDVLQPLLGKDSLRYVLVVLSLGSLWCGWALWRASKTVMRDLEAAQDSSDDVGMKSRLDESSVNTSIAR